MTARFVPLRFISALGPNVDPVGVDVRFRRSARNFVAALAEKRVLDATLDDDFTTVIYRLFYDSDADEFYSSRQFDLDAETGGQELHAGEPQQSRALAYELFTTPKAILSASAAQPEPILSEQVKAIFTHSNTHRPGGVQP